LSRVGRYDQAFKNDRDESRRALGRLFQVRGPATANDISPTEVCVRGTWSFPLSADLIPGRRSTLGWQNSLSLGKFTQFSWISSVVILWKASH